MRRMELIWKAMIQKDLDRETEDEDERGKEGKMEESPFPTVSSHGKKERSGRTRFIYLRRRRNKLLDDLIPLVSLSRLSVKFLIRCLLLRTKLNIDLIKYLPLLHHLQGKIRDGRTDGLRKRDSL